MSNKILKHKPKLVVALSLATIFVYTLSFAALSIGSGLMILIFLLDNKFNFQKIIKRITNNKLVLIFSLLVLAQILGIFYSENKNEAIRLTFTMLPLAFVPSLILNTSLTDSNKRVLEEGIKICALAPTLLLLFFYVYDGERRLIYFVNFVLNKNRGISQFYIIFIYALPFLLSLKSIVKGKKLLWNIGVLLVSLFLISLMKNITSIFLVFLGLYFMLRYAYHLGNKRIKRTLVFVLGLSILMGSPMLFGKINTIIHTTDFDWNTIVTKNRITHTSNSLEHRILINASATSIFFKNPFFGVGTGDTRDKLYDAYKRLGFKAGIKEKYNTHNQYMGEFIKTGLVGGVLFLLAQFFLFKKISRSKPVFNTLVLFFILACFMESYLDRQHGVFVLTTILSLTYKTSN